MQKYEIGARQFMDLNPEVEIQVVTLPYGELVEKIYSAVAAGTGPNMLKMSEIYFKMREEDLLLKYPEELFPHSWYQEAYPTVYWPPYEGYVVPTGTDCSVFFYNKTMFEEAGLDPESPPKTWDEYVEAAKACAKRDASGLLLVEGFSVASEMAALDQAYQLGGKLVTDGGDPKASVNTGEWVQAWEWIHDMYYVHEVADVEFPWSGEALGTRLCAMANDLTWMIGELQVTYADVWPEIGLAVPPTPTGKPEPLYGWKNSVLDISALTGRPPDENVATFRFLEFMYKEGGRETYRELIKLLSIAPVRADLLNDPEILAMPGMADVILKVEPLEYDNVNRPEELVNEVWPDVQYRILNEQEPIPAVLEDANAKLQELIDAGLAKGIR